MFLVVACTAVAVLAFPAGACPAEVVFLGSEPDARISKEIVEAVNQAESTFAEIRAVSLSTVRVVVAADEDQYADLTGDTDRSTAAAAIPSEQTIVLSPRAVLAGGMRLRSIVLHEAFHLLLWDHFSGTGLAPPRWLDEGLAMYYANDWDLDIRFTEEQAAAVSEAVIADALFDFAGLDGGFPEKPSQARLAYAQSYAFVNYLIGRFGEEKVADFIEGLRDGLDYNEAARTAFGLDFSGIEAAWRGSLKGPRSWVTWFFARSRSDFLLWSLLAFLALSGFLIRQWRRTRYMREEEGDAGGGDSSD